MLQSMSWRGTEGGMKAVESGHKAIMTPGEFCYLILIKMHRIRQPEAIGGYLLYPSLFVQSRS